jgi:acyl-coenzyme A synthetase/AMP-(fatty) acid ligase
VPQIYLDTISPDLVVTADGVLAPEGASASRAWLSADEECLILATSGTVAGPKFAAIPARCVDLSTSTIARDLGVTAHDRVQVASPLTYFYGLGGGALMALRQGATVFLYAPPFIPSDLQAAIRRHQITVVQGTLSFHRMSFEFWNGRPFESVRIVTQGGESSGPTLAAQLASAYPIARHVQVFGMTEGGRISHRVIGEPACASNEIAAPFPHIEWKIVPIDKDGGSDVVRLAIRGPTVMLGYVH